MVKVKIKMAVIYLVLKKNLLRLTPDVVFNFSSPVTVPTSPHSSRFAGFGAPPIPDARFARSGQEGLKKLNQKLVLNPTAMSEANG